jgi:hypothetical protein
MSLYPYSAYRLYIVNGGEHKKKKLVIRHAKWVRTLLLISTNHFYQSCTFLLISANHFFICLQCYKQPPGSVLCGYYVCEVLTQNQHLEPSTQQAERSWLNTRDGSRSVPINFPETDKGIKIVR